LTHLRKLTLRSVTLPGLDVLTELPELRSLDIKLGGHEQSHAAAGV
jgi:hypothetical protein